MRVTSAGRVGIGVNPSHPLHVKTQNGNGDEVVKIESESGYDARLQLDTSNGGGAGAHLDFQMDGTTKGGIEYVNSSSSPALDTMIFRTAGNAERMRLGTNGVMTNKVGTYGHYSRPLLEITSGGTPTQIKIQTKIPWSGDSSHAHTVKIGGYRYASAQCVDIQISWHVYNNSFYNRTASSSGAWAPTITMGVENGFVVIHLLGPGYWNKMFVESFYHAFGSPEQGQGWSWTDAAISGDAGKPVETVPYKNHFGNGVTIDETNGMTVNTPIVMGNDYGISFINADDTATGETVYGSVLDDYEYGYFVPVMGSHSNINSTSGIDTTHNGAGWYTKIGRQVTVNVSFNALHQNARDHVLRYITGLPYESSNINFATAAIGDQRGLRFVYSSDVFYDQSGRYHHIYGYIGSNTTTLSLGGSMSYSPYSGWPATHNSASSQRLTITITYQSKY
tara:strand:- start:447 stop:1793 length:1347 start_codon:yes stop_codon:yes gene_type:complete